MKTSIQSLSKLVALGIFLAVATSAPAQNGTIFLANTPTTTFHTNTVAFGGASGDTIGTTIGSYFYEVLTAPSTVTAVDSSLQNLLSGTWSDTGVSGTNTILAGRMNGAPISAALNWNEAVQQAFIVVGWSANEGTSWSQVSSKLLGAALVPHNGSYFWTGGGLTPGGFLGATIVGSAIAGPANVGPGVLLFQNSPSVGTPVPVAGTTELYLVVVPEPAAIALAGLGAALLILRKKAL
jgi:hypothetical protein